VHDGVDFSSVHRARACSSGIRRRSSISAMRPASMARELFEPKRIRVRMVQRRARKSVLVAVGSWTISKQLSLYMSFRRSFAIFLLAGNSSMLRAEQLF
jgi:hypothetical protein